MSSESAMINEIWSIIEKDDDGDFGIIINKINQLNDEHEYSVNVFEDENAIVTLTADELRSLAKAILAYLGE